MALAEGSEARHGLLGLLLRHMSGLASTLSTQTDRPTNQRHGEDDAEVAWEAEDGGGEAHDRLLAHQLLHELGVRAEPGELREIDSGLGRGNET